MKLAIGGSTASLSAVAVLITLATPAAVSRWPIVGLMEPSLAKPVRCVLSRNAAVRAATSIGSPIAVPVPCASTYWMESGEIPANASASLTTAAWPSTLGAR